MRQQKKRTHGAGTLFQRNGWWYYKRMENGRIFCKSCKTKDREEAVRTMADFSVGADLPKAARLAAIREFLTPERRDSEIDEAFARFSGHPRNAAMKDDTRKALRGHWRAFVRWLHGSRDGSSPFRRAAHPDVSRLSQVTTAVASEFVAAARNTWSPNTVNKYIATLKRVWRDNEAERNPWSEFAKLPQTPHRRRALTVGEIERLVESAEGELKTLFSVGAYTGLRMSDCAHLKWEDFAPDLSTLRITPHKTKDSSGVSVALPVHRKLRAIVDSIPGKRKGWLTPLLASWPRWKVHDSVMAHFRKCGLHETEKVKGYGKSVPIVGFHSLRASFVTALCEAGAPLALVQSVVGHVSPEITQMYYRADVERTRSYLDRLS